MNPIRPGDIWQHRESKRKYVVKFECLMKDSAYSWITAVCYVGESDKVYVRESVDFLSKFNLVGVV